MTAQTKVRHKRRRAVYSCLSCRRKKTKCSRESPCSQCIADNIAASCEYQQTLSTSRRADIHAPSPALQESLHPDPSHESSHHSPAADEPAPFTELVSKTRVYGPGHWMAAQSMAHVLPIFHSIGAEYMSAFHSNRHDRNNQFDGAGAGAADLVHKCKTLGRTIKGRGRTGRRNSLAEDFQRVAPNAEITKALIETYFDNFESGYCILHQASFRESFEEKKHLEDPSVTADAFRVQILLVMAVAAPVHATIDDDDAHPVAAWVSIAESWLSHSVQKEQLSIVALQCQCLLLLARQVNRIGSDLVWISCGFVLRMAIQMGLHRDPDCFYNMSVQEKEIRRRLWYTILEMDVQSAVDSGVVSTIRPDDYSTRLPSPLADEEEEEDITSTSGHHGVILQRQLATSLPLRLRILATINDSRKKPPYSEILSLSKELKTACQTFASQTTSTHNTSLATHMLHRFVLALHYRSALESATNPLYTYSHKLCLSTTQNLLSLLETNNSTYTRLLISGGGMFRDLITYGTMILFMEINTELQQNSSSTSMNAFSSSSRRRLDPLISDAHTLLQYSKSRLLHGDTQIKAYVTLSMLLAHVEAQAANPSNSSKEVVSEALYNALHECHTILEEKSQKQNVIGGGPDQEEEEQEGSNILSSWTPFDMDFDFFDDNNNSVFGTTDFGLA